MNTNSASNNSYQKSYHSEIKLDTWLQLEFVNIEAVDENWRELRTEMI